MTMADIKEQFKDAIRAHVQPYQDELARGAALIEDALSRTIEPEMRERMQRQIESMRYYSTKAPL